MPAKKYERYARLERCVDRRCERSLRVRISYGDSVPMTTLRQSRNLEETRLSRSPTQRPLTRRTPKVGFDCELPPATALHRRRLADLERAVRCGSIPVSSRSGADKFRTGSPDGRQAALPRRVPAPGMELKGSNWRNPSNKSEFPYR
jgi:hypothetical protein